jgi:hypothetical protein
MDNELDELLRSDYSPTSSIMLRKYALEKAINTLTRQPTTHTPQDIVHVAEIFYQFLKGEKK